MTPDERLAALVAGEDPKMVAELPSGFVVMGDNQVLPGYCLLLAYPKAGHLLELDPEDQAIFLADMALLGQAVQEVTGAVRCNFAIYGNLDPFLHAHVWPRYPDEPEEQRTRPPLAFPRSIEPVAWSEEVHGEIRDALRDALQSD
ncbi:MAG: HIT family protein [Armatimonadetes bacterium]|nr:HIT family protein [Armatimonadota bacterium]